MSPGKVGSGHLGLAFLEDFSRIFGFGFRLGLFVRGSIAPLFDEVNIQKV